MEGLRWFVLIYFNYSLVHCADLKIGFLVDAFLFSVPRCSCDDLHWFWLPHDILEEVSFILHCQYWQISAFEILDHLVVNCSTFGPHTCVSRSVSSFSSTIIQQTWSLPMMTIKITFTAVFIRRYGLSAVSLNMLLSAVAIEVCFYFYRSQFVLSIFNCMYAFIIIYVTVTSLDHDENCQ